MTPRHRTGSIEPSLTRTGAWQASTCWTKAPSLEPLDPLWRVFVQTIMYTTCIQWPQTLQVDWLITMVPFKQAKMSTKKSDYFCHFSPQVTYLEKIQLKVTSLLLRVRFKMVSLGIGHIFSKIEGHKIVATRKYLRKNTMLEF